MLANETAPRTLGLDFGTTNTVVSWAHPHRPAEPVVYGRGFKFEDLFATSARRAAR